MWWFAIFEIDKKKKKKKRKKKTNNINTFYNTSIDPANVFETHLALCVASHFDRIVFTCTHQQIFEPWPCPDDDPRMVFSTRSLQSQIKVIDLNNLEPQKLASNYMQNQSTLSSTSYYTTSLLWLPRSDNHSVKSINHDIGVPIIWN